MENDEEKRIDKSVNKGDMKGHLNALFFTKVELIKTNLMRHRLLCIFPLPTPIEESDKEQRSPEDEICNSYDEKHFDTSDSLSLHALNVNSKFSRCGERFLLNRIMKLSCSMAVKVITSEV